VIYEKFIQLFRCNRWRRVASLFQLGDVGRSNAADDPICAIGKRRLVDDGVEHVRFDALLLTLVLRENVMDAYVLTEEDGVIGLLP
jgi:hypothetical protein